METVIAIELLAACQGLEFFRPLKTTPALEAVHALVRTVAYSQSVVRPRSHPPCALPYRARSQATLSNQKPCSLPNVGFVHER